MLSHAIYCLQLSGRLSGFELIVVTNGTLYIADGPVGYTVHTGEYLLMAPTSAQHGSRQNIQRTAQSSFFRISPTIINWHVCENLRSEEIADYFGYNEKYLSTLFRKWSGSSIKQFIVQTKMDHARAELCETNHSAAQIGYSDPHNFSNAFKKATGLTPGEYRSAYAKHRLFYHIETSR